MMKNLNWLHLKFKILKEHYVVLEKKFKLRILILLIIIININACTIKHN